jgi:hypothetical protein
MGFLSFLGGIGKAITGGLGKVAGLVSKVAPIVSGIASAIPIPQAQGIAQIANLAGGAANAIQGGNVGGGDMVGTVQQGLNAVGQGQLANTVGNVAQVANNVAAAIPGVPNKII